MSECEISDRCKNQAQWLVNGRYREVQSAACNNHLAHAVSEMAIFNHPKYKRRASDHGVMVYPKS